MPVTIGGSGPITGVTSINTTVSDTELGYLDGVSSALQTQINAKANDSSQGLYLITPTSIANSGGTASASGGAVTFSGVSSVGLNGVFTSTYDNYRIILDFSAASTALTVTMRMRASGSDNSASNYTRQVAFGNGGTAGASLSSSQTSWTLCTSDATWMPYNRFALDLNGPQLARFTTGTYASALQESGGTTYIINGAVFYQATTQFDGFSLIASTGNISGTVRVYGYRN